MEDIQRRERRERRDPQRARRKAARGVRLTANLWHTERVSTFSPGLMPTEKKNQRREIIGWLAYDWANHAFFTLVLGVLIGPYVTGLAQGSVGENGPVITLSGITLVTAKGLYTFAIS